MLYNIVESETINNVFGDLKNIHRETLLEGALVFAVKWFSSKHFPLTTELIIVWSLLDTCFFPGSQVPFSFKTEKAKQNLAPVIGRFPLLTHHPSVRRFWKSPLVSLFLLTKYVSSCLATEFLS